MHILVTGGAGFIASHIVDALVDVGHQVAVIDSLCAGNRHNVNSRAIFYEMDITSSELEKVFTSFRPEIVIHHAAQIDVIASISQPLWDANVNILGSIQLLELCRTYGVQKFIYASSAAVYGVPLYLGIREDHPIRPHSGYGISKHTVEHYLELYAHLYELNYTILRYANVYGMRQDPNGEGGVVAIFVNKWMEGIKPTIFGNGEQTRDFIFIKDIVQANLASLTAGNNSIINIGSGTQTSINQLIPILNQIYNQNMAPIYAEKRAGDIEHSCLDIQCAAEMLNWRPKYSLLQGLSETCAYYKT
jgi:UDP-glucose 4-epimerase